MTMLKDEWVASTISRLQQNDPTLTLLERIKGAHSGQSELLTFVDAIALADALQGNTHVTTIHIESSIIMDEGGAAIVNALMDNHTVTSLILRNNVFVEDDANSAIAAIARLLNVNKTITSLNLGSNHLTNPGIIVLSESLKENTSLTHLHLNYVGMWGEGLIALGAALEVNRTLKVLSINGNYFGMVTSNNFIESLEKNHSLTQFISDGFCHREHYIKEIIARNKKVAWSYRNHAEEACPELHTLIMATLMSANKTNALPRMLPELWEGHIFPHFNTNATF